MIVKNKDKQYLRIENSFYSCQYTISFCTKYQRKIISEEVKVSLESIFRRVSKEYEFEIKTMEIKNNQIIMTIFCNPKFGIDKVITKLKNISAKELKQEYPYLEKRIPAIWTRESFISTMGSVDIKEINDFVSIQKKY